MEDHRSISPPVPSSLNFKAPIKNAPQAHLTQIDMSYDTNPIGRYHDDEMVTYDSPPEERQFNKYPTSYNLTSQNILNSKQFSINNNNALYSKIDETLEIDELEIRPQTENLMQRFNTTDLFTFDEDELCIKKTVHERLVHNRWQVRKQLYVDIADSLRTGRFLMNIETEIGVFEFFEPILKDMAWDSNLTSQLEGLQTVLVYVKLVPNIRNSLLFLADELIQKCALTKQKSGELVHQIIVELMGRDGEGLLLHYIIKRFTAKNPKEACFAMLCVKQALPNLPNNENIGKNLINGLNKTLTHSIAEVRSCSMALASDIFCYIGDDIESFIKHLDIKSMQLKEFKENLNSKEKISEKWFFFAKIKPKIEINDLLILEDSEDNIKKDLLTLVPEGFFDIPYSNEIKSNREKLVKFNHSLEVPGLIIEKKEYPTVVNTILHLIECKNNLIYTEAIKLLEILIPKIPKSFVFKYKHYLQFLSDKFKEKKKTFTNSIFTIIHLFRIHEVCSFENIVDLLLDNSNHKVPQVREYSINWIIYEIQKLPSTIDLLEICSTSFPYEKILENLVSGYGGKILAIASKDTVGTVRDAATRLLNLLKSLLQSSTGIDLLISKLPKAKILPPDRIIDVSPLKSRSPNLSIIETPIATPIETPIEIPIETSQDDPDWIIKEVKEIHSLLKQGNSNQKLMALNRLMNLVESVLSENIKKNQKTLIKAADSEEIIQKAGYLALSLEDLENFIKDIIFLCTKYKNYTQEPSLFEELQQTTINALTSLRILLSDNEAESTFKLLLYHLPVKFSTSQFVKTFNSNVYQLFSDWLSHLSIQEVIILVSEAFSGSSVFNIHIVYIHTLQWFLEIELKLGNFLLQHLTPLIPYISGGLSGGPLNSSHPLSQNTKQQLVYFTQIFVDYLIEIFTFDTFVEFFEEKLVNSGRLYGEFKEWCDKQRKNHEFSQDFEQLTTRVKEEHSPSIFEKRVDEGYERREEKEVRNERNEEKEVKIREKHQKNDHLIAKIEELSEQHEEVKKNLEEVNKEYLTQVSLNYRLMQKLESKRAKHEVQEPVRSPSPKAAEITRTPSFKPCTTFEEILKPREEEKPQNSKAPSSFSIFEPQELDQPVVPFYLQQSEIYNFQHLVLNSKDPEEISAHLLKVYTNLPISHKKSFIQFLCSSLGQEDILAAISTPILKSIIYSIMQFCVIEKLSSGNSSYFLIKTLANSEDLELTNELQKLVGIVMESKEVTTIVLVLIQSINELLPNTFYLGLSVDKKIYLKLLLKCAMKVINAVQNSQKNLRIFDVLLELNKLFVAHPPEELSGDCADVGDYEHMFKILRAISDALIALQPDKANNFLKFISNHHSNRTIFLKYVTAVLSKKYNISN